MGILRTIMFIGIFVIVAGGASWFVYWSLTRMLAIQSLSQKFWIAGIILGLTLGFFAVSAISHWYDSALIKYLYTALAVWMGVWVFLLFFLVAGWVILWLTNFIGIGISAKVICLAMIACAVLYSGYNIWNAYNLQVKTIDVTIKNLPPQWRGKTIVQLSDVHLGNVHGAEFLKNVVDKTNLLHPDIIAITGDLFDGMDGDLSPFIEPLSQLQAKDGIYYISGNHELYLGLDKALAITDRTKIQYIDNKIIHDNGLQIIGIGYGQDFVAQDIKKIITANPSYDPNMPSILLYHIPLPGAIEQAKAMGIGLYLAGHTHVGQLLPFKFITHLVYKGYDYGLHKDGDFSEYTSSGVGTWGPPMRSGNTPEIVQVKLE